MQLRELDFLALDASFIEIESFKFRTEERRLHYIELTAICDFIYLFLDTF